MARPKKDINWELVEKKMEAGCSAREIAGGVCEINTFYERFKEKYGKSFADFADDYHKSGDGNLRFTQYMKALAGNTHMLTLLGRERLGQGKEDERAVPLDQILSVKHENMLLRAELAELKNKENYDTEAQDSYQREAGQEFSRGDSPF